MSHLRELDQQWEEKVALFDEQAYKQLQTYEEHIQMRTVYKERADNLKRTIQQLQIDIEINLQKISKVESLPNYDKLKREYERSQANEKSLADKEKERVLSNLVEGYRRALEDLDIDSAQTLLEQLEDSDHPQLPELKEEIIKAIKKL